MIGSGIFVVFCGLEMFHFRWLTVVTNGEPPVIIGLTLMVLTAKTYILKSLSLQYDPNHVNLTNKHFPPIFQPSHWLQKPFSDWSITLNRHLVVLPGFFSRVQPNIFSKYFKTVNKQKINIFYLQGHCTLYILYRWSQTCLELYSEVPSITIFDRHQTVFGWIWTYWYSESIFFLKIWQTFCWTSVTPTHRF